MSTWLLPENIADVLPSEARKIEELRRRLLDRFRSYGYEMVMPPLLEYIESLLTGGGHDLNLRSSIRCPGARLVCARILRRRSRVSTRTC
jgi:ATP phosphoribosyltransferase regulatory subunit